MGEAASGFALVPGEAVTILRRARLLAGEDCDSAFPLFTWVPGQGPRHRPEGIVDRLAMDRKLFLHLHYRKGFETEGLAFEDAPEVVVFAPEPSAGAAVVETLAVEAGESRLAAAALLAVVPPDGVEPGDGDFLIEAVSADGRVETLLRIRRFDPDWSEKYAFREPVWLSNGASVRVSHPGGFLDLIRTGRGSPAGDP